MNTYRIEYRYRGDSRSREKGVPKIQASAITTDGDVITFWDTTQNRRIVVAVVPCAVVASVSQVDNDTQEGA